MNLDQLDSIKGYSETIERRYGITLRWSEFLALYHYSEVIAVAQVIPKFMMDYFGLNEAELGKHLFMIKTIDGKRKYEYYGMELLGMQEFKQYCRQHVQEWRDERELI